LLFKAEADSALADRALAHLGRLHLAGVHHLGSTICGLGPGLVGALFLGAFDDLLVFDLFLHVLVALKNFVVFNFTQLEKFVHASLKLLLERVHFVLLFLHHVGF